MLETPQNEGSPAALGAFRRPLCRPLKIPADTSKQPGGREAPGPPGWRPLQTRLRRARLSLWKEQEDDLFEVGIEGVALNPNRK